MRVPFARSASSRSRDDRPFHPATPTAFVVYDDEHFPKRRRPGNLSNPESPKPFLRNPFFQRSRSNSSGGKGNGTRRPQSPDESLMWPTEPIYSEPLPPLSSRIKAAERRSVPQQQQQLSTHIYEYLVSRRTDACTQAANSNNIVNNGRRGSLASSSASPSSSSVSASTAAAAPKTGPGRNRRGEARSSSPPLGAR